jgi:hypothetical protein
MLNRSKIVIDVEPFIFAQTFRRASDAAAPHAVRKPRLNGRVNYLQPISAARHAAPQCFQMVMFGTV